MNILGTLMGIIYLVMCLTLVTLILSQKKRSAGGFSAQASNVDTYWSKNKNKSKEGQIEFYTKIGIAVFLFGTILMQLVG